MKISEIIDPEDIFKNLTKNFVNKNIKAEFKKPPDEVNYEDIVKDKWLFQHPYAPDIHEMVVINNGAGYYFCGDKSVNAEMAGSNKRPLTVKERFTIELLRNCR